MDEDEQTVAVIELADPHWRPRPFPGSAEACAQGCLCPPDQPWPGSLEIDVECPVHEIGKGLVQ